MRVVSVVVAGAAVPLVVVGGVVAYDSKQADRIADGVRIAGLHVGGMTRAQAQGEVRARFAAGVAHPVVVHWKGRRFTLAPERSGVRLDVGATVDAAVARSRRGSALGRGLRDLTGGDVDADVAPVVTWSNGSVRAFVRSIRVRVDRRARDADIAFVAYRIRRTPARSGRLLRRRRLERDVGARLASLRRDPDVAARVVVSRRPERTLAEIGRRYPRVITISKTRKILRFYSNLRLARTYRVAIGMAGYDTPAGRYAIQTMQTDPAWHAPNAAWAGSLAGQTIPPGDPRNPLKARWMGFLGGAGIHGTGDPGSLGSAASHGCIRMAVPDVVKLYRRVKVGTPVFIA